MGFSWDESQMKNIYKSQNLFVSEFQNSKNINTVHHAAWLHVDRSYVHKNIPSC